MENEILIVLNSIRDDIDYLTCRNLISGKVLRSFDIINMIAGLEEKYDIEIEPEEMNAENFDSLEAIVRLIASKTE